ncbi:MFS transporter [Rhodovulum sp. FJ3]|uniref:MFS transporter n=1 Tax=Rhodovulum sp. FJ3 TaxID=3079053 RepID=UPI00293DF4FE|nr:MFS transporter [Rhodovulum sp. FJ3]MDV4167865.1 MFS transporter [Rhodovulum sp. FJ3]
MSTPSKTRWPLIIGLFVTGLLAAAQFGKFALTLPQLGEAYARSPGALALMVSIVGVVGVLFGPFVGGLIAAFGIRRAILWALGLGAAMSVLQALVPPYPVMLALRVVEGVGHLVLVVAVPTLMAELATDRDRPVVMGLWGTFFGVSFAILGVAVPVLVDLGGMRAVTLAHGVALVAMAVGLGPSLPRSGARQAFRFNPFSELHLIYTDWRLFASGLVFFWHSFVYLALLSVLPSLLEAGAALAILPLLSLFGTFGAGFLARRYSPMCLAATGFAGNLAIVGVAFATGYMGVGVFVALFLATGLVPGAAFASLPWLNADVTRRARAGGALAQIGNLGTFSGPPVFAITAQIGGIGLVLALVGVVAITGGALALYFGWRARRFGALSL